MVKFVIKGGQEGMFGVVALKLSTVVGISQGVQNVIYIIVRTNIL